MAPYVIDGCIDEWLFLDSVIVLGFGKILRSVLETVWMEWFSEFIIFVFNNEGGSELFSDFLSMLLFNLFQESRNINVLIPFLLVLFALEALDLDKVCHESLCMYKKLIYNNTTIDYYNLVLY